jgi:acyl carrier protein
MKEKVFDIVSKILGVPPDRIDEDSSPDSIEDWDSLKHMNLVMALEQEFHVQFTDEQIIELLNVKLIILTLEEMLQNA